MVRNPIPRESMKIDLAPKRTAPLCLWKCLRHHSAQVLHLAVLPHDEFRSVIFVAETRQSVMPAMKSMRAKMQAPKCMKAMKAMKAMQAPKPMKAMKSMQTNAIPTFCNS